MKPWTSKKPTEVGWYWWKDLDRPGDPICVHVINDGYGLIVYGMEEYSRRLYETRGEWQGPILPKGEAKRMQMKQAGAACVKR